MSSNLRLDNMFFNKAVEITRESERLQQNGNHLLSWLVTAPARLCYAIDALVSLAYFACSSFMAFITAPVALYKWKLQGTAFNFYQDAARERYLRIFSSATGVISVTLAKNPQNNLAAVALGMSSAILFTGIIVSIPTAFALAFSKRPTPYRI